MKLLFLTNNVTWRHIASIDDGELTILGNQRYWATSRRSVEYICLHEVCLAINFSRNCFFYCTVSSHNDNPRCNNWWQIWHNDHSSMWNSTDKEFHRRCIMYLCFIRRRWYAFVCPMQVACNRRPFHDTAGSPCQPAAIRSWQQGKTSAIHTELNSHERFFVDKTSTTCPAI